MLGLGQLIVEHDEDGRPLHVVREVPGQPARPFDYLAVVEELWGEDGK
jgi:hypothetical protein